MLPTTPQASAAQGLKGPVMMSAPKLKLVGIGGSLRKASCNKGLLRAGLEYANTLPGIDAVTADYSQLPLYNGDLETKEGDIIRFPPEVEEFRALVASADAFLFAVPEYNYSLPGVLKNAIDWASRAPNCFADKPAAVLAAGGISGGMRSANHLRQVGVFLDLHFINKPELHVQIFSKPSPFDAEGNVIDEKTTERIHRVVDSLRAFTYRLHRAAKTEQ
ncbi:NADPH quinone oxidoreductase [Klebsormidium nitens]|uniref:NAD(P)H dehydrogenase (quinone) n=1 Tax=Klebsormidium nitens TaxID=105231 RepID=A0A1Y1IHX1_KLENI|nr:NADPH quinone oxidoreductase [Klebsormidium nitens]|eukprot:GAQ88671.1 NADPH quinone oxidoreductase [Klebsormidium nitens]